MTLERWLTPDEYAKERKVSTRTVYRLIQAGRLEVERIGKQWRIFTPERDTSGRIATLPPRNS